MIHNPQIFIQNDVDCRALSCANAASVCGSESVVVILKNVLGETVMVNPANVTWCKDQNESVMIYFDKDHQIEVKGPLVNVQRELNSRG